MTVFWRRQTVSGGNYPPAQANSPGVPYWPQTLAPQSVVGRLNGTGPTEQIPISSLLAVLNGLGGNEQIITTADAVTVGSTTDWLIINKSIASVTPINLGSVSLRSKRILYVFDYSGLGGDMTFTPFGSEKVNGLSSWTVASGGAGLGGSLMLIPNTTLSGWLAR